MLTPIEMSTLEASQESAARRGFEIASLDGLRAFSILLVFLSHTELNGIVPGGFGVTVFFFLSGYLITTLLRWEAESRGSISLRNFYYRRCLRIFPPLYTAITLGLILTLARLLPNNMRAGGVLSQALFFTNYYMILGPHNVGLISGLSSLWSLAVEEHFYVLFPAMYLLLRRLVPRPSRQLVVLGIVWLAISLWRSALVWLWPFGDADVQRASLATDTRLDSILIGCMLAVYENPAMGPSRLAQGTWKKLLGAGIAVLMISFLLPGIHLRESIRYSMQNWGLVPVFVCAIRWPDWLMFRWLNLGWVKFVGVLSYSLYLVHYPILSACERIMGNNAGEAIVGAALSLATATAIYIAVERPCARLRKRLR